MHAVDTKAVAPALHRVARGSLCAGCGGCALAAPDKIKMEMVPPGFLRPRQISPISAEEDARISRICPGLGQRVEAGAHQDDILWGPYVDMETGHATDPELRYRASSGGALSAMLTHLLNTGAVDGVIQTTAAPDIPVANVTVLAQSAQDIGTAAGSRYAPSAPLDQLNSYLEGSKRYAFVGKPCDVACLRALAREDPRIDTCIPVLFSFFCGGVPSQQGAEKVLEALGTDLAATTSFRYRGHGWPGFATARLKDGTERRMSYHDSWGKILSAHVQLRCKICADGTGMAADIVCADAWESDDRGYPLFEEQDGTSLIVARTEQGRALVDAAKRDGAIACKPFDVARLARIQPGQATRHNVLAARLAGLLLLGRPIPRYRGLHLVQSARKAKIATLAKNFLGIVRRAFRGRLSH